jgi:hypothetical protein
VQRQEAVLQLQYTELVKYRAKAMAVSTWSVKGKYSKFNVSHLVFHNNWPLILTGTSYHSASFRSTETNLDLRSSPRDEVHLEKRSLTNKEMYADTPLFRILSEK